jgi:equilibrative nucleoside transporter 1/2/3
VIIAMAGVDSDSWQNTFLIVNLTTIALLNVVSAAFQGSFCANLGKFPVRYLGNVTNGAGMGGLLPSVVNVIILAVNGDAQTAGFFCFLFAGIMAAVCLVLTVYLDKRNTYYQYYSATYDPSTEHSGLKGDVEAYKHVFKHAWVYILATLINFTTTLIAFPAVTVLVRPISTESNTWNDTLFVPVLCFVLYNLGDYVGKTAASLVQWPKTSVKEQFLLLAMSIVRIAFIPLFMYCNVSPGNRDSQVPLTTNRVFRYTH